MMAWTAEDVRRLRSAPPAGPAGTAGWQTLIQSYGIHPDAGELGGAVRSQPAPVIPLAAAARALQYGPRPDAGELGGAVRNQPVPVTPVTAPEEYDTGYYAADYQGKAAEHPSVPVSAQTVSEPQYGPRPEAGDLRGTVKNRPAAVAPFTLPVNIDTGDAAGYQGQLVKHPSAASEMPTFDWTAFDEAELSRPEMKAQLLRDEDKPWWHRAFDAGAMRELLLGLGAEEYQPQNDLEAVVYFLGRLYGTIPSLITGRTLSKAAASQIMGKTAKVLSQFPSVSEKTLQTMLKYGIEEGTRGVLSSLAQGESVDTAVKRGRKDAIFSGVSGAFANIPVGIVLNLLKASSEGKIGEEEGYEALLSSFRSVIGDLIEVSL